MGRAGRLVALAGIALLAAAPRARAAASPRCAPGHLNASQALASYVRDPHVTVIARHRLVTGRQVDDGQPSVTKPDRAAAHHGLAVWPAMSLDRGHGSKETPVHRAACHVGDAGDPAHVRRSRRSPERLPLMRIVDMTARLAVGSPRPVHRDAGGPALQVVGPLQLGI